MSDVLSIVSLVVAVIAASLAFWQASLSRQQLDLARQTNTDTDKALSKIRELTKQNKRIAEELKEDFDQRIGKVFDNYVEREERAALAKHEDDRAAADAAGALMGWLGSTLGAAVEESLKEDRESSDAPPPTGESPSA